MGLGILTPRRGRCLLSLTIAAVCTVMPVAESAAGRRHHRSSKASATRQSYGVYRARLRSDFPRKGKLPPWLRAQAASHDHAPPPHPDRPARDLARTSGSAASGEVALVELSGGTPRSFAGRLWQRLRAAPGAAGRSLRPPLIRLQAALVQRIGGAADALGNRLQRSRWRFLRWSGRTVKYLLGTETLERSSFDVAIGMALAIPHLPWAGTAGGSVAIWSGDARNWRRLRGRPWQKLVDVRLGIALPVGGVGWTRVAGVVTAVRPVPWAGAYRTRKGWGGGVGMAHVASLGFGYQDDRGHYVSAGLSIPLGFVRLSGGLGLYYPPLSHLTERMRPLLHWMQRAQTWLHAAAMTVAPRVDPDFANASVLAVLQLLRTLGG